MLTVKINRRSGGRRKFTGVHGAFTNLQRLRASVILKGSNNSAERPSGHSGDIAGTPEGEPSQRARHDTGDGERGRVKSGRATGAVGYLAK